MDNNEKTNEELTLEEAQARIRELEYLQNQNVSSFDHVMLFLGDWVKYTFYFGVLFVILTLFGII